LNPARARHVLLSALPQLCALLLAALGGLPRTWVIAYCGSAVLSILLANRVYALAFGQLIAMTGVAAPGIVWLRLEEGALPRIAAIVALILLPIMQSRMIWQRPLLGRIVDDVLAIIIVVAFGFSEAQWSYVGIATVCLLACLAIRQDYTVWRRIWRIRKRLIGMSALAVIALSAVFAVSIRALYWARVGRSLGYVTSGDVRTGLTDAVRLDSGAISNNSEVVLRVFGPNPEYLQGSILDTFDGIRWYDSRQLETAVPLEGAAAATAANVRIVAMSAQRKLALPANVAVASLAPLARAASGEISTLEFRYVHEWSTRPGTQNAYAPVGPRDVQTVFVLRAQLRELALSWVGDAESNWERSERISAHLHHEFRYSLTRNAPSPGVNRLADFLFTQRVGHCEYFATAHAMLLRSLGIPARVVTGFRVVEQNPYGNFITVRAKHAHSWVLVWVPNRASSTDGLLGDSDGEGQFRRVDPTPASLSGGRVKPSTADALFEYARERATYAIDLLGRSPELVVIVLAVVAAVLLILRALARKRRRIGVPDEFAGNKALRDALAGLALRGISREMTETLHALAERVERAERPKIADVLREVALARYGGRVSDYEASLAELARLLREWERP
jgi:transglutaminase-like putative cysteine protease